MSCPWAPTLPSDSRLSVRPPSPFFSICTDLCAVAADRLQSGLLSGQTSGILGLAFPAIASTRSTPFWQNLLNDNQLETPEFSFWMTRLNGQPDAGEAENGGVFTLGGTNSSLFSGEIEFLDLATGSAFGNTPTYWLLPLQTVTVQGSPVNIATGSSALSAIDTGTTLIGGPSDDVARIWAAVPGSTRAPNNQGLYVFPCRTQVNVTLNFGGRTWAISSEDMNLGPVTSTGSMCAGAIFDLNMGSNIPVGSGNPSWVVGATFLKNVYSVFRADPPSIGFAELSTTAGGQGTAPGTRPASAAARIGCELPIFVCVGSTMADVFSRSFVGYGRLACALACCFDLRPCMILTIQSFSLFSSLRGAPSSGLSCTLTPTLWFPLLLLLLLLHVYIYMLKSEPPNRCAHCIYSFLLPLRLSMEFTLTLTPWFPYSPPSSRNLGPSTNQRT